MSDPVRMRQPADPPADLNRHEGPVVATTGPSVFWRRVVEWSIHLIRGAAVTFLIDGYNLMHAVGLARRGLPAGALQRGRTRFLDWLAETAAARLARLEVVFDAGAAPGAPTVANHRGVGVRFASGQTADDEIEALLAVEPRPSDLTVVSNDNRVREAGRRRGAAILSCEEFVDWTLTPHRDGPDLPRAPEPDEPETDATAEEMAAWLAAFSLPPSRRRNG